MSWQTQSAPQSYRVVTFESSGRETCFGRESSHDGWMEMLLIADGQGCAIVNKTSRAGISCCWTVQLTGRVLPGCCASRGARRETEQANTARLVTNFQCARRPAAAATAASSSSCTCDRCGGLPPMERERKSKQVHLLANSWLVVWTEIDVHKNRRKVAIKKKKRGGKKKKKAGGVWWVRLFGACERCGKGGVVWARNSEVTFFCG